MDRIRAAMPGTAAPLRARRSAVHRFVDWLFGSVFSSITRGMLFVLVRLEKFLLWVPWWAIILVAAVLAWRATRRWGVALATVLLMLLIGAFGLWEGAMTVLHPLLDAMQTMPSFVYLIPAMMLFGLGKVPAIFATVIYAVPPVIRLTDLGIRQVEGAVVEAAEAFGSSRRPRPG